MTIYRERGAVPLAEIGGSYTTLAGLMSPEEDELQAFAAVEAQAKVIDVLCIRHGGSDGA